MNDKLKPEQLADKWITDLRVAGYNYRKIVEVLGTAFEDYEQIRVQKFEVKHDVTIVKCKQNYTILEFPSTESETRLEVMDKYLQTDSKPEFKPEMIKEGDKFDIVALLYFLFAVGMIITVWVLWYQNS